MKLYTIIGIVLFLCSCSIKNDIIGKYMSKKNPNYFQFKKDHIFIYEYRRLHLYQQSTGKWDKVNNLIILNSEVKSTTIPLKVINNNLINSDNSLISIVLNIKGSYSLSDYICGIFINDTSYCVKRCDSLSSLIIKSPINNIYFKFFREPKVPTTTYIPLPLITNTYTPEAKTGNKLEIKVDFSDTCFYYKAFNNDTLKIKGNGIKMFNSYQGKWEKISKVPDATNLFSRYNDKSTELNIFR
ncbi:MAG: hypothetical protein JWP44_2464 [Mucilaginibacter sp.]|nr:hypothetical protein [Mucilaginibacter sp.]